MSEETQYIDTCMSKYTHILCVRDDGRAVKLEHNSPYFHPFLSGVYIHKFCIFSRESLVSCLGKGLDEADVLITSGGVSMGEKVCMCAYARAIQCTHRT